MAEMLHVDYSDRIMLKSKLKFVYIGTKCSDRQEQRSTVSNASLQGPMEK